MEVVVSNTSMQYGKACQACSHSKCRCIPRASGPGCQRCHRLQKECRPAMRVRKPKTLSKTAQLEQKLDGLISKLQSKSEQTILSPGSHHPGQSTSNQGTDESAASISNIPSQNQLCTVFSVAEEEQFLQTFCRDKLYYFPFIYITPGTSVHQLKQNSPFLWQCIIAAQTGSSVHQAQLVTSIMETAARKLLVDCTKNLDLLQGLFVYAGWITYQAQPQKRSSCVYTQMAVNIVLELGLDKPPRDASVNPVTEFPMAEALPHLRLPVSSVRTMNERRAAVSCYILSSANSQLLGREDPLRWNSHLTESLNVLSERRETQNDLILVEICRIRLIADRIVQLTRREHEISEAPQAPLYYHVNALRLELAELVSKISPDIRQDKRMIMHISHAEISLYSIATLKLRSQPDVGDTKTLDYLYACLMATKRYFDCFYKINPTEYTAWSGIHLIEGARCLYTLFLLTVLEYPGWDRAAVRNTVDIKTIVDYFERSLQQAEEPANLRTSGNQPGRLNNLLLFLRNLQARWGTSLQGQEAAAPNLTLDMTTQDISEWGLNSMFAWPMDLEISGIGTLDANGI